jgi:hypothetical protein
VRDLDIKYIKIKDIIRDNVVAVYTQTCIAALDPVRIVSLHDLQFGVSRWQMSIQ